MCDDVCEETQHSHEYPAKCKNLAIEVHCRSQRGLSRYCSILCKVSWKALMLPRYMLTEVDASRGLYAVEPGIATHVPIIFWLFGKERDVCNRFYILEPELDGDYQS